MVWSGPGSAREWRGRAAHPDPRTPFAYPGILSLLRRPREFLGRLQVFFKLPSLLFRIGDEAQLDPLHAYITHVLLLLLLLHLHLTLLPPPLHPSSFSFSTSTLTLLSALWWPSLLVILISPFPLSFFLSLSPLLYSCITFASLFSLLFFLFNSFSVKIDSI